MLALHKYGKTIALTAAAIFAAGITLASPNQAQAASKTGNFLLGAAAGAAGIAIIHGLNKKRRAERAPRRYYRRAPARRYYKPRAAPSAMTSKIQESLNVLGFNVGVVDGLSGPATRAGSSQFQMSIGQPATGYLTELQKSILFQKAQAVLTGAAPAGPAGYPAAPAGYPAAPRAAAAPGYAPLPPGVAPGYAPPPSAPGVAPVYPVPAAPAAPGYAPPPPPAPAQ